MWLQPHRSSQSIWKTRGIASSESKIFSIARPWSDCFVAATLHTEKTPDTRPSYVGRPKVKDKNVDNFTSWMETITKISKLVSKFNESWGSLLGTISDNHIPRHSMCLPTFGYFFGKFSLTHHTLSV